MYKLSKKVCTDVKLTRIDDRTMQVCLATTSALPHCRTSATYRRLAGVFFSSEPFGVGDAWQLNVENGTIQFETPYCTARKTGRSPWHHPRVDRCGTPEQANSLRLGSHGMPLLKLDVGLTVANDVSWSGTADAALGCFYVTGPADQPDSFKEGKHKNIQAQVARGAALPGRGQGKAAAEEDELRHHAGRGVL